MLNKKEGFSKLVNNNMIEPPLAFADESLISAIIVTWKTLHCLVKNQWKYVPSVQLRIGSFKSNNLISGFPPYNSRESSNISLKNSPSCLSSRNVNVSNSRSNLRNYNENNIDCNINDNDKSDSLLINAPID